EKAFKDFLETDQNPEYVQLNLANEMLRDKNGKIWIGTYAGGLWAYEYGKPANKCFTHYTVREGLTNNSYYSLVSDENNTIWMLEGKGLTAINNSGNVIGFVGR